MDDVSLQALLRFYEAQYTERNRTSARMFERAKAHIAGGVSGYARLMRPYPHPIFFDRAKGSRVYDIDGHEYIDTIGGGGAQILGHDHPAVVEAVRRQAEEALTAVYPTELEVQLAEKITSHNPHLESLRFTSAAPQAAEMVLETARAFTRRDKVAGFEGSGADSTLALPYNETETSVRAIKKNAGELAAVVVEPVCVLQCGVVPANREFLRALRDVTTAHDIPLVFDEVMTGFRLGLGGATELLGVKPDLAIYGKIIGGGMPIGAFGGRRDIMESAAASQAREGTPGVEALDSGSSAGDPISLAAGIAMISELERLDPYPYIENITMEYKRRVMAAAIDLGIKLQINSLGSFYQFLFMDEATAGKGEAARAGSLRQRVFSTGMTVKGVVIMPGHPGLMSNAHSAEDVDTMVSVSEEVLTQMAASEKAGTLPVAGTSGS